MEELSWHLPGCYRIWIKWSHENLRNNGGLKPETPREALGTENASEVAELRVQHSPLPLWPQRQRNQTFGWHKAFSETLLWIQHFCGFILKVFWVSPADPWCLVSGCCKQMGDEFEVLQGFLDHGGRCIRAEKMYSGMFRRCSTRWNNLWLSFFSVPLLL